jgi:hypothetical protein
MIQPMQQQKRTKRRGNRARSACTSRRGSSSHLIESQYNHLTELGSNLRTWEETSLSETKEKSAGQEGGVVLDQTHHDHDEPPEQDDTGEEHTWCEALEHDIGGRLSQTV